jgi:hypothetical protein
MEESIPMTICHTCGFSQEVDKSYSLEWPHACAAWLERLFWSKDHTLNCPDFDEQEVL